MTLEDIDGAELNLEAGVLGLQLARPPGNRFSWALLSGLTEAVERWAAEPTLRAVWLSAAGADFSQGADLTDPEMTAAMQADGGRRMARVGQRLLDAWARLPVPTICGARGWIVGAGACMVLASDFRFAAPGARVRLPEVDRGMHLAWGVLPRLVAELGLPDARWLTLTGEALEVAGLRSGVFRPSAQPEHDAHELARALAHKAPLALRAIKQTLNAAAEVAQSAADDDVDRFAQTVRSADFLEAMSAFFEKRAPHFHGR